jgi:diguanylate cyclase (GGDEF)-like protein
MLGSIIRENIRETDFAGRLGGEEFSVVLPETSAEDGKVIAERIRNAVHSIKVEDRTVSVSLGVTALIEKDRADSGYLRSDKALYKSKKRGRDCTTVLLR